MIRTQPPQIKDPKGPSLGTPGMGEIGVSTDDTEEPRSREDDGFDWMKVAREAYRGSTDYFDTNYRKRVDDSINAFNNKHPSDSKYNNIAYQKRSQLFRPKTRSIIRKNEAAAASAFFSNNDVMYFEAQNQGDMKERISAEVTKAVIQYRLNETIPWFMTLQGAVQDAQKSSVAIARVYWDFSQDEQGETLVDEPKVKLIPVENFRFDPAADYVDPVKSSPYLIELLPMYVGDIKQMMNTRDPKTGRPQWLPLPDQVLQQATADSSSTRAARGRGAEDPKDGDPKPVSDYTIAWVQRHIHRRNGKDWVFYTLGDLALLSDPIMLKEEVFHGQRDYVVGCWILETHTTMPASMPELVRGLQDETNEVANQRLDNVKLVLNKRWFVARGKNVDIGSLMRNVPGGATMMDKPTEDVHPVDFQDVTQSSYAEQDRINVDFDELAGNFSATSVGPQGKLAETVGGAQMLSAPASLMTEYGLRTFVESFVLKVIKLLVKLEQHYETDTTLISLCAQKSQMFQRYGQSVQLDQILNSNLSIRVNVGMGATDPGQRLARLSGGLTAFTGIVKNAPPWFNLKEIGKEFWGLLGYQDGTRFFVSDDPMVADLQMKLQQSMQFIQQLGKQIKDKTQDNQTKFEVAKLNNETKETIAKINAQKANVDPKHKALLEAHSIALKHELNETELQHKMEMKMKEMAFEAALKVRQLELEHQSAQIEMRRGEEQHQQGMRHKDEMMKTQQKVMLKPKPAARH